MTKGTTLSRTAQNLGGSLLLLALAAPASAQVTGTKTEAQIQNYNLTPETARESVFEQAKKGPADTKRMMAEKIAIEEIERTETALSRLRNLVNTTPAADPARADYLFRLAELYYERARYYEQRSYDRRDQAFEQAKKDPARAEAYRRAGADDLHHSTEFAQKAISLYTELYANYRDTFANIDAVLFYLGANLLQADDSDSAREVFEALAVNFPTSQYMTKAYFMIG
jgi:tetratricopeptide (TPR) repeat protein